MIQNIFLVDINSQMTKCWKKYFEKETGVFIINKDFGEFMLNHPKVDCIISSGNSFGHMSGGLDAAYIDYFGQGLQEAVQKKILDEHLGEQPIASSIIVDIPNYENTKLIHTPSMRLPQLIIDPRVVYSCTRSSLVMAIKKDVQNIVLPAFGHLTGRVKAEIVSELMYKAYKDVCHNRWDSIKSFEEVAEIDSVLMKHYDFPRN